MTEQWRDRYDSDTWHDIRVMWPLWATESVEYVGTREMCHPHWEFPEALLGHLLGPFLGCDYYATFPIFNPIELEHYDGTLLGR